MSNILQQRPQAQPALTMDEMWQAWPNPQQLVHANITQDQLEQLLANLSLDILSNVPAGQRQSLDPASPRVLAAQNQIRITKFAIYEDIVSFYHQEKDRGQFLKRWKELHAPAVVATSLDMRLKRATEGKDAANKKYTGEDNWFGAMYTYALAWGCLMPFYPEALAATDPNRLAIGKLEGAIWSNIAATCVTGSSSNNVEDAQKPGMIQLGLRSALVCMAMSEYITVGVMLKACNRAIRLRELLRPEVHQIPEAEAAGWKKQVEAMNGLDQKMMFNDIKAERKIVRPRYADLAVV